MWAVEKGRECVITKAFENGVRLETTDDDGWTAVMYAARRGNLQILKTLLEFGASLNHATNEDNFTALHLAAGNELVEVCLALIKAGANPNQRDSEGKTAGDYLRISRNKEKYMSCMEVTYGEGMSCQHIHDHRVEGGTERSVSLHIEQRYSSK